MGSWNTIFGIVGGGGRVVDEVLLCCGVIAILK